MSTSEKLLAKLVRQRNMCDSLMLCLSPLAVKAGKVKVLTEQIKRLDGQIATQKWLIRKEMLIAQSNVEY